MKVWHRLVVLVVLAVPAAFYLAVPLEWQARRLSSLQGDEPHYLIIADAIVRDHSLSVQSAYERDAERRVLYGPVDWWNHAYVGQHGIFSIHSIGVPVLVAPFYAWFGIAGARALLASVASLVPLLFFFLCRRLDLGTWEALALASCVSFGLPFLVASGQVYPDLVTGVVVLALASTALAQNRSRLSLPALLLAGLLVALLPWLHLKNAAPAAVFGLAILALDAGADGWRLRWERLACLAVLPAVSLVLLAWYNTFAFASALGAYTGGEAAGATLRQAAMIFLGLHLDQTQGIFLQQPLFLLGLPGLAIFARRSPGLAVTLAVAYLSIVLPNSFHDCWYGCNSITGRFMWSVAALWAFPLAFLYREARGSRIGRAMFGVAAAAALVWQIVVMRLWWTEGPQSMYRVLRADVVQRDHVFYRRWWPLLPSFYDFKGYLSYVPNLVALAVVLGLVAVGVVIALRVRRDGDAASGTRERDAVSTGRTATSRSALATNRVARRWAWRVVAVGMVAAALAYELPRTARPRDVLFIDLTERLADAAKWPRNAPGGAFVITTEAIAGDTRRAIGAHPPTRIVYTLTVPPNASLKTGIGVDERSWAGRGVVFRIAIVDGSRHQQAMWKPMMPRVFRGDRRWVPVFVDLSEYARRSIEIVFSTESNPQNAVDPGSDRAYWAAPAIFIRR